MKPADAFRHCPKCGKAAAEAGRAPFLCAACGFLFYFNPAIAVGAVLLAPDDTVLLIRRAKDPHRGKLSVPGGFVDAGEVAEAALRREIREEVGMEVERLDYLCSQPNQYHYRGVTYQVLDFFYLGHVEQKSAQADPGEVSEVCWIPRGQIVLEEIAFDSVREMLRSFWQAREQGRERTPRGAKAMVRSEKQQAQVRSWRLSLAPRFSRVSANRPHRLVHTPKNFWIAFTTSMNRSTSTLVL